MYRMSGFRVGAHDDVRRIRVMASFARVGLTLPVGKALLRPKNLGAVDLLCSRRALHSSFRLRLTTSSDVPGQVEHVSHSWASLSGHFMGPWCGLVAGTLRYNQAGCISMMRTQL